MATTIAPPPVGRLDHQELRRFLGALRVQLWWRDALVLLAVGGLVGTVGGALVGPWLIGACLAVGAVVAVVRRPSVVQAARVADRQLHTSSRLATAAEVLGGHLGGALAPAQLQDTWRTASALSAWRAYPRSWRRVQVAAVALGLSVIVAGLLLAGVFTPVDLTSVVGVQATSSGEDAATASGAADDQSALRSDTTAAAPQTIDDLQAQAAQSQAALSALQRLGDQLRTTAAARDIGDALRGGNYDDAIGKLNALATQSDQLSRNSKRELGAALEKAAVDTAKADPPLAAAEDRVARALSRNVYSETRSAMQDLANAVGDARNGVISQEALARELDQLQQRTAAPGGGGGDIGESEVGYIPDIPGEAPNQVGLVQGMNSSISVPGPEGDPSRATHSGVGQEAGGDPFGDLTSRLDVPAPSDVSVAAQVSNDQGRGGLKPDPVAPVVKISDAAQNGVSPSDVAQPSEPVQATAEQNVEPTAQRNAVRSFFKPDSGTRLP